MEITKKELRAIKDQSTSAMGTMEEPVGRLELSPWLTPPFTWSPQRLIPRFPRKSRGVNSQPANGQDLVWQILTFARQTDEKTKPLQIGIITKEVLKFIRSSIPTTIEIKQNIDSESLIMGNPAQAHQIIMNLCMNAAHAMDESGGVLEVSVKDVTIDKAPVVLKKSLKQADYVEIKVSDTGTGIPANVIESIFEPYFTTKSPGEGTGLGLSVVQGIVEKSGGKITVESQIGKESSFCIYLPITKKREVQRLYKPEKMPKGTERILLIDDEAPMAKMGAKTLETLGYDVTTRTSSIEAMELFQTKPGKFDLIITDMTMPEMSGDILAVEMLAIRPDIPIILCTGYSKKITVESASEIGIKDFAYKPIIKSDLAKTVRKVLDEAQGISLHIIIRNLSIHGTEWGHSIPPACMFRIIADIPISIAKPVIKACRTLQAGFAFQPLETVDFDPQQFGDAKFGFHAHGIAGPRVDQAQTQIFSAFRHNDGVYEFCDTDAQFLGDI